jgi:hypothetical protein
MMAMLWSDVATGLAAAKRHFSEATALFRSRMRPTADDVTIMAFQHATQSGYTSFEAAVKRMPSILDEPLPAGPDSHAVLNRRLGSHVEGHRPAFVDRDLRAQVEELDGSRTSPRTPMTISISARRSCRSRRPRRS